MMDCTGKAEKVVVFHINTLSKNSNATYTTTTYNWVDQLSTFLVRYEEDLSKHRILPDWQSPWRAM